MKAKRFTLVGLVIAVIFSASPGVFAISERNKAIQEAGTVLKQKSEEVKAVIKDLLGSSLETQYQKATEELKKNPNSLDSQLNVVNILIVQAENLSKSIEKAKKADLADLRDRVVKGFKTISELKAAEAQRYQDRAKEAKGPWKTRYEQLSTTCLNLSKAYALRAEPYEKLPINEQIIEIQNSIEYLDCVKEVLVGLRDAIETIKADEQTLKELLNTQAALNSIQKSILEFSETVLDGALQASKELIILSEGTKAPVEQKSKSDKKT